MLASGALTPDGTDGPAGEFEFGMHRVLDSIEAWIADTNGRESAQGK